MSNGSLSVRLLESGRSLLRDSHRGRIHNGIKSGLSMKRNIRFRRWKWRRHDGFKHHKMRKRRTLPDSSGCALMNDAICREEWPPSSHLIGFPFENLIGFISNDLSNLSQRKRPTIKAGAITISEIISFPIIKLINRSDYGQNFQNNNTFMLGYFVANCINWRCIN